MLKICPIARRISGVDGQCGRGQSVESFRVGAHDVVQLAARTGFSGSGRVGLQSGQILERSGSHFWRKHVATCRAESRRDVARSHGRTTTSRESSAESLRELQGRRPQERIREIPTKVLNFARTASRS